MTVHYEQQGAVVTVVIDRPEVRNAIDRATAYALAGAFRRFDAEPSAAVAVLCGAGDTFCAGADLKAVAGGSGSVAPRNLTGEGDGPLGPTRMLLDKPVIAAVNGYAVAGGLELALWCDLRIAEEGAIFGCFERRWGVPLVDGGTWRLPRIVGFGRALDLMLTGRAVTAAEALTIGLATRVVPAGEGRHQAEALAAELAQFPQLCMRSDRRSAYEGWGLELAAALQHEATLGNEVIRSGETQAGARRFAAGQGRHGRPAPPSDASSPVCLPEAAPLGGVGSRDHPLRRCASMPLHGHFGVLCFQSFLHLCWGDILYVRHQRPLMPEGVDDRAGPIAVKPIFKRPRDRGPGVERTLKGGVDVLDIHRERDSGAVERLRRTDAVLRHLVGQHEQRIADHELSMTDRFAVGAGHPETLHRTERPLVEVDRCVAAPHMQIRRQGTIALRDRLYLCGHDTLLLCDTRYCSTTVLDFEPVYVQPVAAKTGQLPCMAATSIRPGWLLSYLDRLLRVCTAES